MLSVGHVVTTSVGMCDIDIRPVSIRLILLVDASIYFKAIFFSSQILQHPVCFRSISRFYNWNVH